MRGILSPLEIIVVIARVILFLGAGAVLGWLVTEGLYRFVSSIFKFPDNRDGD